MMDDFSELLAHSHFDFIQRSIAREIQSLLSVAQPAGSIRFDVSNWASAWCVEPKNIWKVIDHFEAQEFWITVSDEQPESLLKCVKIAGEASIRKKRQKKQSLLKITDAAREDRSLALKLSSVGPSSVSQISVKIPQADRKKLLERGYDGWLPTSHFGLDGLAFKPDEGLIKALAKEFPDTCVHTCFTVMFGDLRQAKKRPDLPNVPYWIRQWMTKNACKIEKAKSDDEIAALINNKMDDY